MKAKPVIALFFAVILVAWLFYWQSGQGRVDKTAALNKAIAPVFLKFRLTDDRLVKKTIEENKLGAVRYINVYVEYDAPDSFVWKYFEKALRLALKNTGFVVFDVERSFEKDKECHTVVIKYGKFDVLALKVKRKASPAAQTVEKIHARPRIAIVIDDFGYSNNNLDVFLSLKQPITLSVLPEQHYTREVTERAKARGFETILHLPMEPNSDNGNEEADTIKTGMSEREIVLRLKKDINSVPGIDGVSNHMGSKATANTAVMTSILRYLKSVDLYYFDSLTTSKSVCTVIAVALGVKHAKRDMFLDNSNNTTAIEKQLEDLKIIAFKRGSAIAIGHDRKNTAAVLARIMPVMAKDGVEFVRLSEMVSK